jgi:diadenosine tetraphosphate (Ap4A) HIT family hydrolase
MLKAVLFVTALDNIFGGINMLTLHEGLHNDTIAITRLKLCRVQLMDDSSFPWLILVPARRNIREIYELEPADRALLIEEVALASRVIVDLYKPDKLNIGSMGNLVPQLHIHVIGRFRNDRVWPGPVWGQGPAHSYAKDDLDATCKRLREAFAAGP